MFDDMRDFARKHRIVQRQVGVRDPRGEECAFVVTVPSKEHFRAPVIQALPATFRLSGGTVVAVRVEVALDA